MTLPLTGAGPSAGGADGWDPNSIGLSIWAAYEPINAATLAASYVDLSGNGNDAAVGVAPTLSSGWVFNGSTQYLTTTFVPDNDQSQAMFVQFSACTGIYDEAAGTHGSGARDFSIRPYNSTNVVYYNGGNTVVSPQLLAGNLGIVGSQPYRNGSAEGSAIGAWAGTTVHPLYIGAMNNNGTPGGFCALTIEALYIYDATTGIDATQAAAIATAMAAL